MKKDKAKEAARVNDNKKKKKTQKKKQLERCRNRGIVGGWPIYKGSRHDTPNYCFINYNAMCLIYNKMLDSSHELFDTATL
jgi:hypothetical protein